MTPPYEIAAAELQNLKESNLLESGAVKRFHFSLSHIIRSYFETQFGLPTTERTLEEIQFEISSVTSVSKEEVNRFIDILRQTDMVKFTDHDPGVVVSLKLLTASQEFIEETKPKTIVEDMEESVI